MPRALVRSPLAGPLLVGLLAAVAFAPSVAGRFVADDFILLRSIDRVQGPLWPFGHTDLAEAPGSGHFYRPLWLLTNAGVHAVFGARAGAFHVLNLVLFALIAVEVLLVARALLPPGRALLAAGAFALYPRHAESVSWVSGNTDLLAVAVALGALVAAAHIPRVRGLVVAGVLAALAALTKEAAFVLPLLAVALVLARRPAAGWRLPVALAAAQLPVLLARLPVVGGLGGYGDDPLTLKRAVGSVASYGVGSLTPPQLEVLREPVLLAVPLLLLVGLVVAVARLRDAPRRRVALLGAAWWLLAVLPLVNLPLDLNTGNGERLLLLPSVGLALLFAAVIPRPSRAPAWIAAAGAAALALCLWGATDWIRAGQIADAFAHRGAVLAAPTRRLVLLTVPTTYRTAHVFPDAFDAAIQRYGGTDLAIVGCAPVHLRSEHVSGVQIAPASGGAVTSSTTSSAPFDVPVFGAAKGMSPGCGFTGSKAGDPPLGTALRGTIRPPLAPRTVYAVFDGTRLIAAR